MFRIKRGAKISLTEKEVENIDSITSERLFEAFHNCICIGDTEYYKLIYNAINKLGDIDYKKYLEYALVYGRYKILEQMLLDNKFVKILKPDYDPFILEYCDPFVNDDIFEGSWWGNDEHERNVVNKLTINHMECFNMLRVFGKQLTTTSIKKWIEISYDQVKYFNGTFFCDLKKLIDIFFDSNIDTKSLILWLEEIGITDFKQLLKILCIKLGHNVIIQTLKQ